MTNPLDNKKIIGPYSIEQFATEADINMVEVSASDLDRGFSEQPGLVAYFGNLFGRAKAQTLNLKLTRDGVEAQIAQALRDKATEAGEKVVETKVASQTCKVAAYKQVCEAYHEAVSVETALEGLYLAARGRKSSLEYFAQKKIAEMTARGHYRPSSSDT